MSDLYIPRGYICTVAAVDRLFAFRYPDLASGSSERQAEMNALCQHRKVAEWQFSHLRPAPEFTEAHEKRLQELNQTQSRACAYHYAAASEIRAALAEGDFSAIIRTPSGHEFVVPVEVWRGEKGLSYVRVGVAKIPRLYNTVAGWAFIKEVDFAAWMSPVKALPSQDAENSIGSPHTEGQAPEHQAGEPPRHKGGRPRKWDWDAFDREMMRVANTPDGLPDRPTLQKHMLEWCEHTWDESPGESMVRERIARLYPKEEFSAVSGGFRRTVRR